MVAASYANASSVGEVNLFSHRTITHKVTTAGREVAGRVYSVINCTVRSFTSLFAGTIGLVNKVCGNPDSMQKCAQIVLYSLLTKQAASGVSNEKLIATMIKVDEFVDLTGILRDGSYFIKKEYKKDLAEGHNYGVIARVGLLAVDIFAATMWFAGVGAIHLGNMARCVGRFPLLSCVQNMALATVTRATLVVSFSFLAMDSFQRIGQGERFIDHALPIVYCASQIVFFGLATAVGPTAHAVQGIIAASTGLACFLYSEYATKPTEKQVAA